MNTKVVPTRGGRNQTSRPERSAPPASAPATLAAGILGLQRTAGNQVVQRVLQRAGPPGLPETPEQREKRLARFRGAMLLFGGRVEEAPAPAQKQDWVKGEKPTAPTSLPAPEGGYETTEMKDSEHILANKFDNTTAWRKFQEEQAAGHNPRGVTAERVIGAGEAGDGGDTVNVPGLDADELEAFRLTYRELKFVIGARGPAVPSESPSKYFYWKDRIFSTEPMKSFKGNNEGRAIYVMTGDGAVYTANQEEQTEKFSAANRTEWRFFHSSFLAGKPVAAAGEIEMHGGKLVGISDQSGHYLPGDAYTLQLLKAFLAAGVDMSGVYLDLYHGGKRIVVDAAVYAATADLAAAGMAWARAHPAVDKDDEWALRDKELTEEEKEAKRKAGYTNP